MAEEKVKQKEEVLVPSFKLLDPGVQMAVKIPKAQIGKWITKLGSAYNPQQKAYIFLTSQVTEVEQYLGLPKGASGLKDPKHHYTISLDGSIFAEDFDALRKTLEGLGIYWSKPKLRFEGKTSQYAQVSNLLVK